MGETYRISSECGYTKELDIGGGLAACDIDMVNKVFSEEKLIEFKNHYSNREIKSFLLENALAFCDKCKEIMTVSALTAQLIDSEKLVIINDCPSCGNRIQIIDTPFCPKCGKKMIMEEIGHWD